jgi:phosphatidylinositol 4-kinase
MLPAPQIVSATAMSASIASAFDARAQTSFVRLRANIVVVTAGELIGGAERHNAPTPRRQVIAAEPTSKPSEFGPLSPAGGAASTLALGGGGLTAFRGTVALVSELCELSLMLSRVPIARRTLTLRASLDAIAARVFASPESIYMPGLRNANHKVLAIHSAECSCFKTATRAPFLVVFEIVEYATTRGLPLDCDDSEDDNESRERSKRLRACNIEREEQRRLESRRERLARFRERSAAEVLNIVAEGVHDAVDLGRELTSRLSAALERRGLGVPRPHLHAPSGRQSSEPPSPTRASASLAMRNGGYRNLASGAGHAAEDFGSDDDDAEASRILLDGQRGGLKAGFVKLIQSLRSDAEPSLETDGLFQTAALVGSDVSFSALKLREGLRRTLRTATRDQRDESGPPAREGSGVAEVAARSVATPQDRSQQSPAPEAVSPTPSAPLLAFANVHTPPRAAGADSPFGSPHAIDPDVERELCDGDPGGDEELHNNEGTSLAFPEQWDKKCARIAAASPFSRQAGWGLKGIIVKANDDLRQEQFVSILLSVCLRIFKDSRMPVYLRPYAILATGPRSGLIEAVVDTTSIDALKKSSQSFATLAAWFRGHFSDDQSFRIAAMNFCRSLAGSSVVSYLLQIKDRHNGNILIDRAGRVINIDFGFLLTSSPGGNINFESRAFKLSGEMIEVLGGPSSSLFATFRKLCIRGFLALRRCRHHILLLVQHFLAAYPDLPCFQDAAAVMPGLRSRFCEEAKSDRECVAFFSKVIDEALSDADGRTEAYDRFQLLSQGIR